MYKMLDPYLNDTEQREHRDYREASMDLSGQTFFMSSSDITHSFDPIML